MKKVINAIGNVFVTVVLVLAILITVLVISSTKSEVGIPSLFGYAIMNVESNSMEGEKGFYTGDLIVIRLIDDEQGNNLKVGDVITFQRSSNGVGYLETHRIVENTYETIFANEVVDGIRDHNGTKYYTTMGDNTIGADMAENGGLEYSCYSNIIGVWEGTSIPKLGTAIKFLKSQMGFMVCIVAPLALLFFFELYSFIVTMNEKRKETALAEVAASEDEIRQKAVAEFLAQQQAAAQAQENTAPAEEADEEALKKKTIEEYLAQQAAQKTAEDAKPVAEEEKPAAEVPEDMTPPTETE